MSKYLVIIYLCKYGVTLQKSLQRLQEGNVHHAFILLHQSSLESTPHSLSFAAKHYLLWLL